MMPFDLSRAKKGIPVYTRNGVKANFVADLNGGQPAPVLVEIWGELENFFVNGRYEGVHDSPLDLFMEY